MAQSRRRGSSLVLLAGLAGAGAAAYDYLTPATGIDHTMGVQLVFASSLLLVLGALVVMATQRGFIAGLFVFLIFLGIAGTATAGYFLQSVLMMGAMALAALGWLQQITSGKGASI